MTPYLLPDGKVFVPRRIEVEGVVGDVYEVIDGDSEEAVAAAPWTVPATPDILEMYRRWQAGQEEA